MQNLQVRVIKNHPSGGPAQIIEIMYTEAYLVYPADFMIEDSENKDFARKKFCKSENKLFAARFTSNE